MGFEPTTSGITIRSSNQLSYVHHRPAESASRIPGAPGRTRTCDPRLRRPMLYPLSYGRTHSESIRLVGAEGFEPPTLCSQSRCATRLRHAPPCTDTCRRRPSPNRCPAPVLTGARIIRTDPCSVNLEFRPPDAVRRTTCGKEPTGSQHMASAAPASLSCGRRRSSVAHLSAQQAHGLRGMRIGLGQSRPAPVRRADGCESLSRSRGLTAAFHLARYRGRNRAQRE